MKIAFIGQKGIPAKSGGVERHAEELAVELAKKGHEVFVYVRKNYTDSKIIQYKGVHLIHLPSINTKNLDAISHTIFSIFHAIFKSYDVIHFHSIGPSSLSFLVKILKPKTTLVATYHCQDYFHQKWGFLARTYLHFGEYVTCNIPDKTIAVTKILQNFIQKKFGRKSEVVSNGANVSWNKKFDRLSQWQIEKGEYILTVSRLIRHKGIHYLIQAFKELEKNELNRGKKLVIVGEGFYTTQYVEYLMGLAQGSENIIFTGAQSGENLSQLFSHAYFFVQPSDSEGLSIALLEAMGYGKASLVSNIPENLEAIGGSGMSFSQGNVDELRNNMAELIDNPEKVNILAVAGKKRVEKYYNWETIASEIIGIYRKEIDKKNNKHYAPYVKKYNYEKHF